MRNRRQAESRMCVAIYAGRLHTLFVFSLFFFFAQCLTIGAWPCVRLFIPFPQWTNGNFGESGGKMKKK